MGGIRELITLPLVAIWQLILIVVPPAVVVALFWLFAGEGTVLTWVVIIAALWTALMVWLWAARLRGKFLALRRGTFSIRRK